MEITRRDKMLDDLEVCEYDNYIIPEQGEDTPENRILREKAKEELLRRFEDKRRHFASKQITSGEKKTKE